MAAGGSSSSCSPSSVGGGNRGFGGGGYGTGDGTFNGGIPTPELMAVIDQHMEAIKVVYPSEYNAIVAKIRSLHEAT